MIDPKVYKTVKRTVACVQEASALDTIFLGDSLLLAKSLPTGCVDLIFSSPPYCMGKEYEKSNSVEDFSASHEALLPDLVRALKDGGSICWQVGYHSDGKRIIPLDFLAHQVFSKFKDLNLRNRVIWSFNHGPHASKRLSGRHEVILWYTKGKAGPFDLDSIRVPQKYPGKRSYKGKNKGEYSGNPMGKNPGDLWEAPSVKGSHIEKTEHPCQFPVALPLAFVMAASPANGLVFDPFMGVGSAGVAAAAEGRRFLGAEVNVGYVKTAVRRIADARNKKRNFRPWGQPILSPRSTDAVVRKPPHFKG